MDCSVTQSSYARSTLHVIIFKMEVMKAQGLTLGDGSHSQSHSNLEIVDSTTEPGASMDGIIEMADVDNPHGHANEGDDLRTGD